MVLSPSKEEAEKVEEMCEVKEIGGMTNEQENSLQEEFHSRSLEKSMQPFAMEISHEQSKDQETQVWKPLLAFHLLCRDVADLKNVEEECNSVFIFFSMHISFKDEMNFTLALLLSLQSYFLHPINDHIWFLLFSPLHCK